MHAVRIDVSKGKSNVAIINVEGEIVKGEFEIAHDINGINKLFASIMDFPKKQVRTIMESTGIYHLSLLNKLVEFDYFVTVENALKVKKHLDSSNFRRSKNR